MNRAAVLADEGLRRHAQREDGTCIQCVRLVTGGRVYHLSWPCPDYRRYEALWLSEQD